MTGKTGRQEGLFAWWKNCHSDNFKLAAFQEREHCKANISRNREAVLQELIPWQGTSMLSVGLQSPICGMSGKYSCWSPSDTSGSHPGTWNQWRVSISKQADVASPMLLGLPTERRAKR